MNAPAPRPLTGPGRVLLARIAEATAAGAPLYVWRDPGGGIGAGVSQRSYERLLADGLITVGDYVPFQGRPLDLTDAGRERLPEATVMTATDGYRGMAVAAYAGSLHGRRLLGGLAVLGELHAPADMVDGLDLRCPTCRDTHGRRAPWPCRTYVEMLRGLGCDPGPAVRLVELAGRRLPPPLDVEALVHDQRTRDRRAAGL